MLIPLVFPQELRLVDVMRVFDCRRKVIAHFVDELIIADGYQSAVGTIFAPSCLSVDPKPMDCKTLTE